MSAHGMYELLKCSGHLVEAVLEALVKHHQVFFFLHEKFVELFELLQAISTHGWLINAPRVPKISSSRGTFMGTGAGSKENA